MLSGVYCTLVRLTVKTLYSCVLEDIYIPFTHTLTQAHNSTPPLRTYAQQKEPCQSPKGPLSSPFNPTLITLITSYTPLVSMSPSDSIAKYPLVPLVGVCAAPLCLSEQITIGQ
jgi:hypothetical protein